MSKVELLIGTVRRLGRNGPPYEVIGRSSTLPDGAAQLRIRVIESNEDLDYPLVDALRDPLDD